jgi:membrane-associated PAP2 superfamily phosphatase
LWRDHAWRQSAVLAIALAMPEVCASTRFRLGVARRCSDRALAGRALVSGGRLVWRYCLRRDRSPRLARWGLLAGIGMGNQLRAPPNA